MSPSPFHLELDPDLPDKDARPDRAPRWLLRLRVRGSLPDAEEVFLVHNLSATGLLIETSAHLDIGSVLALDLPLAGQTEATVEWVSGNLFGCSFQAPISTAAITAALLKNPPAASEETDRPAAQAEPDTAETVLPTRLRNLRESRGLSLEGLASRVNVSRQTVWYWETGRRTPSPHNLGLLAHALGVPDSDLKPEDAQFRAGNPDTFSKIKERIANELGVAPERVEIHIRL
jgi:transcriptional regulator with XRE-family HTH domain